MKLYATITSERASKGQGGNDYLHIKIYGKNQTQMIWMNVEEDNIAIFSNEDETLDIINHGSMAILRTNKENCGCKRGEYVCREHYQKAKKQKGE